LSRYLLLLGLALGLIGCDLLRPKNVQQEQNRFRFDWIQGRNVPLKVRGSFVERFARNVELLEVKLQDEAVQRAVRESNSATQGIPFSEIQDLDQRWQSPEATDEFVASLLDMPCGRSLIQFQRRHPEFVEIFVTNSKGMNVCQTNRTSDYYQADEKWWTRAFNSGKASHGELEHDESVDTLAVAMYVPVRDTDTGAIIGVSKALMQRGKVSAEK
jgi:hypothetical protein